MKILNAIPGFGAPLSEQEIKDFLGTKVLNVHLGTVDEKGDANIHPGTITMSKMKRSMSKQGKNLRK